MEISSDKKSLLLKKLMAEKGFKAGETEQAKRSIQLERFHKVVDNASSFSEFKLLENSVGSTVKRTLSNVDVFQKAYANTSKVVFVGNAICSEVFFAMDMVPFNVEILSSLLSKSGTASRFLDISEKNDISRDICAVVRCVLGAAIDDCLPSPDFVAFLSYPCDSASKMFYALSDFYNAPYFLIDIPYRQNKKSILYLADRIKEMTKRLENVLPVKMDHDRLKSAIEHSKTTIRYYNKFDKLYAKHGIGPSVDKLLTDMISNIGKLGSRDVAEAARLSYEEIKNTIEQKENTSSKRPRVIWRGLMPFYTDEIIRYIEDECGIDIISEVELENMDTEYLLMEDDPYIFMAKRLIMSSGSGSFVESFDKPCTDIFHGVDGVILFNQWGCRHTLSLNQIIRDTLSKKGISVLEIDGDFVDEKSYSFSQIKVRIDAFAEMLKEKI